MSQVTHNLIANFAARGWYALITFAFVPLYIHFLGMEAYGLVGFYATLQALFGLLDFGLGATINRQLARYSVQPEKAGEAGDLVRTLEIGYWALGITIGATVLLLSPAIANHWVNAEKLDAATVQSMVMLMAGIIALQWPFNLYAGGLRGLQRQVLLSGLTIGSATLRGVGAILVLWLVSPTIEAFFWWQMAVGALQTAACVFCLKFSLPKSGRKPRFRRDLLNTVWPFASRMTVTSLLILLLSQLDKVLLSKILPLELFGYYSVANTASSAVLLPMAPISEALFPRLSQLVSEGDSTELQRVFHHTCQLSALALFPVASLISLFSAPILFLWTGDPILSERISLVTSLLALGVALNYSVMGTLDLLQMAYGWLQPSLLSRLAALVLCGPIMTILAYSYGSVGVAVAWLAIYVGYAMLTPHFVFRRLMVGDKARWYVKDVLSPMLVAFSTAALWRFSIPIPMDKAGMLLYLAAALAMVCIAVAVSMAQTRQMLKIVARKLGGG